MIKRALGMAVMGMACMQPAVAYDVRTHDAITRNVFNGSILGTSGLLKDLGVEENSLFPSFDGNPKDLISHMRYGAWYEDERAKTQAFNHFYNPLNGRGLILPTFHEPGTPSPSWALEDDSRATLFQPYSYKEARQYFYDALTKSSKSARDSEWGKTFQTLGHVIHHIQDMAQPQHVRNDIHCDNLTLCGPLGIYHDTGYEQWTRDNPPRDFFSYGKVDPAVFTTPRKFWTTTIGNGNTGKGIAEYTNRGFFSHGTIYNFSSPQLNEAGYSDQLITVVCDQAKAAGRPGGCEGLQGKMRFYANLVEDTLRPDQTSINSRALTSSLFDHDLKSVGKTPVFALNRFNFDEAQKFLIPRAVSYSTGLVDYFFRGKLEFVLNPDNSGKYLIKNLSNEAMKGNFTLYYDDKDGKRHETPNSWNLEIGPGQSSESVILMPNTVGLPEPKVPGEYLLVFKGTMGDEKAEGDSVGAVVGAKVKDKLSLEYQRYSYGFLVEDDWYYLRMYPLKNAMMSAIIRTAIANRKPIKFRIDEDRYECQLYAQEGMICNDLTGVRPTELQFDLSGEGNLYGEPYILLSAAIGDTGTFTVYIDDVEEIPLFSFAYTIPSVRNSFVKFREDFHGDTLTLNRP